jgi:hypothetical protein
MLLPAPAPAQDASPLGGVWTLNRSLSELPREIGFNVGWMPPPGDAGQSSGSSAGGRGRRGGGGNRAPAAPFSGRPENYEDARRLQLMTAEARNPPARLMIVDTPSAVTITNELGQSRVLHPDSRPGGKTGGKLDGNDESIEIQGVPIRVTSKREADRLVVVYHVEQDRDVRYTYSASASPSQLIAEIQFLEHGAGDKAKCVYEPGVATETSTATDKPSATEPSRPPGTSDSGGASGSPGRGTPASPGTPGNLDARPGAELRGLKSLGILVEDLSAQAVACGLNHDAIESALTRRLTDGGFAVRKNSDEDTYLYVNVMTTSTSNGTCVSRYDAFLYTHATANLSYHDQPVLVQVSLMHRGGIGTSAPVGHAGAVTRGLENYVDLFVTQIHDANK